MQPGYGPPPAGERWNVNMPAVIGVVFVFLVGVVVWVVVSSSGDDDAAQPSATASTTSIATGAQTVPGVTAAATTPPTLSPTPLPSTVPPTEPATTTTTSTTVEPATTTAAPAPATTAPGAESGAVLGDLAVPGRPMQKPPCDDGYITVLASAIGQQASPAGVGAVLEQYPGSNYLRTDQTCSSLNASSGGEPIYVIFYGPFAADSDACAARADGPEGAYARRLSNEVSPQHSVTCA